MSAEDPNKTPPPGGTLQLSGGRALQRPAVADPQTTVSDRRAQQRTLPDDPTLPAEVVEPVAPAAPTLRAEPGGITGPGARPARLCAGDVVDEAYEIEERLGQGGMGVVYAAQDLELKRRVAIKFLLGGSTAGHQRFHLEAVAAARVRHPGVVAVHRVGEIAGSPYYVMDHVEGESLNRYLEQRPELDRRRRVELFVAICQAVRAAHQKGVIHRDLKPGNILVDRQGAPRVLDFGVAKLFTDDLQLAVRTLEGELVGTPAYMAPEQAGGSGEVDTRTDVFALGVILYQLLTGVMPFLRDSLAAMIHAVVYDDPEPMTHHGCDDRDLEAVVCKAMAKAPAGRYQSVDALARDLGCWLAGEAVTARPRSALVQAARFVARHYVASGVLLLVLLSLPAGLGYRSWRRDVQVAELAAQGRVQADRLGRDALRLEQLARLARTRAQDAAARRKLREAARAVEADTVKALSLLERGLALDPEGAAPRQVLLEVLLARIGLAERLHQDTVARMYMALARSRDLDGSWAERIRGKGTIKIGDRARGARVILRRFALDRRGVLVAVQPREMGPAPLGPLRLPTGSYLLTLRKPGHSDTRLPLLVRRGQTLELNPRILTPQQIPRGYVYVPGGRFLMGNLADTFGEGLAPWQELELPGYFMRRHPFTAAEVVAFLGTRPPGERALFTSYFHKKPLLRHEPGRGGVLWLPRVGEFAEDQRIQGKRWDITAVGLLTYPRAKQMVRWEAQRIGRPERCVSMPSLAQYQKAGRGADGRAYPWGNTWIPGAAAVAEGRQVYPVTAVPGSHPLDTSVYGITDLVGNVTSWTSTPYRSRHGSVRGFHYVAGGAFSYFPRPLYVLSFYSGDESASEIGVRPVVKLDCVK